MNIFINLKNFSSEKIFIPKIKELKKKIFFKNPDIRKKNLLISLKFKKKLFIYNCEQFS